jgi:hypothetical protein
MIDRLYGAAKAVMIPTRRHDEEICFRMVDPVPGDEARDSTGKKLVQGVLNAQSHPMIAARYRIYSQGKLPVSADSLFNAAAVAEPPYGGMSFGNRSTPLNASNANDSSLRDLALRISLDNYAGI